MWQAALGSARRILCLGAHSDDIEIGLGGTLLKLIEQRSDLEVWWIVFSAPGYRAAEAQKSANDFFSVVTNRDIRIGSFRESFSRRRRHAIKDWFEEIKAKFNP